MGPGADSNSGAKLHRNQAVVAVGRFELPATLPSKYKHWYDRRLSVDMA